MKVEKEVGGKVSEWEVLGLGEIKCEEWGEKILGGRLMMEGEEMECCVLEMMKKSREENGKKIMWG